MKNHTYRHDRGKIERKKTNAGIKALYKSIEVGHVTNLPSPGWKSQSRHEYTNDYINRLAIYSE